MAAPFQNYHPPSSVTPSGKDSSAWKALSLTRLISFHQLDKKTFLKSVNYLIYCTVEHSFCCQGGQDSLSLPGPLPCRTSMWQLSPRSSRVPTDGAGGCCSSSSAQGGKQTNFTEPQNNAAWIFYNYQNPYGLNLALFPEQRQPEEESRLKTRLQRIQGLIFPLASTSVNLAILKINQTSPNKWPFKCK